MTGELVAPEHPLTGKLRALGQLRKTAAGYKECLDRAQADLDATMKDVRKHYMDGVGEVSELDRELRLDAVWWFNQNGDKHPIPGVDIDEPVKVKYEAVDALAWAKDSGQALALNRTEFERLMKALDAPPEWCFVGKLPRASIAGDIEEALGKE
jgi:hypothetical protein